MSEPEAGAACELALQETKWFVFGSAPHCANCSRVLDGTVIEPPAEMPPPRFDISVTYDGCVIVSDHFVTTCAEIAGARFTPIAALPGFSTLDAERIVRLEPFDSHVRSGPACDDCGGPRYRVRRGPLHLDEGEWVRPGFSRSDLAFGDTADFGPEHPIRLRPVILLDEASARAIKTSTLTGIHVIAHAAAV